MNKQETQGKKNASAHLKPITPEERREMIQTAAYFHAQLAHFQGTPEEHWQAATQQVDDLIKTMKRRLADH